MHFNADNFRENGKYFGFPQCCIDYFVDKIIVKQDLSVNPGNKMYGTGYVPCPDCNKKSRVELINFINNNGRDHSKLFPSEDNM